MIFHLEMFLQCSRLVLSKKKKNNKNNTFNASIYDKLLIINIAYITFFHYNPFFKTLLLV